LIDIAKQLLLAAGNETSCRYGRCDADLFAHFYVPAQGSSESHKGFLALSRPPPPAFRPSANPVLHSLLLCPLSDRLHDEGGRVVVAFRVGDTLNEATALAQGSHPRLLVAVERIGQGVVNRSQRRACRAIAEVATPLLLEALL
jgi:hypothetical protein